MTQEEIEGNKLIAEFMGYKYFESNVCNDAGMDDVYSKLPIEVFTDEDNCKWFADLPNPDYQICKKNNKWNPALKNLSWATLNFSQYMQGQLKYNSSWDWLMPVVEKIEKETDAVFQIYKRAVVCIYDYNKWQLDESLIDLRKQYNIRENTKIEAVWLAVVEFIKWYNQNKQS